MRTFDRAELGRCCSSTRWIDEMAARQPFRDRNHALAESEAAWAATGESDWLEAFRGHPKIGDLESLRKKFASTGDLAGAEQKGVVGAADDILQGLAQGNDDYEKKFGFIFIVCATGKSAAEMLALLRERLPNERAQEMKIAAGEQAKITRIRLEKLLHDS